MKLTSPVWIVGGLIFGWLTITDAVSAQIVPDDTLPENSRVEAGCTNCTIEGGTTRGSNLFHSFRQFSVPTAGSAFFNNAAEVENILTRVTGNSVSNIDGLLRSNGTANLFLLNPNGIIFGANARLDIGGAFVTSTADAIAFPSGEVFSAINPTAPTPLLNVNPNALLFNQLNPQPIVNRSTADTTGLTAAPGQSLAFVGGDVQLEGGRIRAAGGRVELGGLSEPGAVGLNFDRNNLSLSFPNNVDRADVLLNNNARINVRSSGGGDISINARDFTMSGRNSRLFAGIDSGLGFLGAQAGDIQINAGGTMRLDAGRIINEVQSDAIGDAGNINISADTIIGTNSARLSAPTFGRGNGGNITLNARDSVSFDSVANRSVGGIISGVQEGGIGNAGEIDLTARNVSMTNGSAIANGVIGRGSGGDVTVTARGTVSFEDGGVIDTINPEAIGSAGDITITAGTLSLTNGAELSSIVFGRGDAGDITVNASDTIFISGVNQDRFPTPSGMNSGIGFEGVGEGGNINITTGSLIATDGGNLVVSTGGQGNAGDIVIRARDRVVFDGFSSDGFLSSASSSVNFEEAVGNAGDIQIQARLLTVTNGAGLSASTNGQGRGGNIVIDADEIQVSEGGFGIAIKDALLAYYSGIFTSTDDGATGRGGDIRINTNRLQISDSAVLTARTFSDQPGGNIEIDANTVELSSGGEVLTSAYQNGDAGNIRVSASDRIILRGFDPNFDERLARFGREQVQPATASSGLFAQTEGAGRAGDIQVQTPELIVRNQAQVLASTTGQGRGGSLTIIAPDRLLLSNGQLSVATSGNARAGNLSIDTGNLTLNGGQILASSTGSGAAGNLSITADNAALSDRASVTAETRSSLGGNIAFNVQDTLQLQNNSQISASTRIGTGGSLSIDASSIQLSNNSQLAVTARRTGSAGNLNVRTGNLGVDDSSVTVSNPQGQAGTLSIQADGINLRNEAELIAEAGGNSLAADIAQAEIQLQTDRLVLRDNSLISARASGSTNGGNITIDAENGFIVAVPNENSDIIASAEQGNGGRIDLTAQQIFGFQEAEARSPFSEINASSQFGTAGTIFLNTPDVDPAQGLTELPADVVDASDQIAIGCSPSATAQANRGEFYQTGRGGIAPLPTDALGSSDILEDLQPPTSWTTEAAIVEAQGWQINDRGEVELVTATHLHCGR